MSTITSLPTLYKSTKTGATQVCNISSIDDTYTVEWGQLDGAQQDKVTTCYPKNIGKSNEITAEDQAAKEAQAKWVKKKKEGYSESIEAPTVVKLPQLVKKWTELIKTPKRFAALIFPCWIEDKENGINFTFHLDNDVLTGSSRGGEPLVVPPHQVVPITQLMNHFHLTKLNVEQFIEDTFLEDIHSAVTKHNDNTQYLVARLFEIPELDLNYEEKVPLKHLIQTYCEEEDILDAVSVVIPHLAETVEDIDKAYDDAISRKREGIIITNSRSVYTYNERSSNVWKRKPVLDAEFKILGMKIDKNGNPVFTCQAHDGILTFNVSPKGTKEEREAIIPLFDTEYLGKWYKVEFEVINKAGKPSKPIGICLRECDTDGKPLI